MKLLFLRGQVPQDRDPSQIIFNKLEECDDVWTHLAYNLCENDNGEIWYYNGIRTKQYKDNFTEIWIPDFKKHVSSFQPDVIFARGGFAEYDSILEKYPKAYKIYYGAGRRFYPQHKFKNFNLILNDTEEQIKKTKKLFPKSKVSLFIKPAAENIFRPFICNKNYDVIMVANEQSTGSIKGHDFFLPKITKNIKCLQLGIVSDKLQNKYPLVKFKGWVPRKKVANYYSQAKVSVICTETIDSCPRVIPESLACGCPILVLDRVNFWHKKYITPETGELCNESNFDETFDYMIRNYEKYKPYDYYKDNLSMEKAVQLIKDQI